MRTNFSHFFLFLTILALTALACNLPVSSTATGVPAQSLQPMIEATETLNLAGTQTSQPATETLTALPTETPEPTATATVEIPKAQVNRESNCRSGPGGLYNLVATYQAGQILNVVAKDLGSAYWFVQNPDKPEEQCYVMVQNVTVEGDTSALPKFTPQPSPTPPPYFEAKFKKIDICNGNKFANFSVENTGSVIFRSAYIKVTDTKANKSAEQALNVFDLYVGCTLAKNISPLDPGDTGYVPSAPLNWNVHEDKLRASIMLCSEKDLKGVCVTRTLEVGK